MSTEDEEQRLRRKDLKELTKSIVALAGAQEALAEHVKQTNEHALHQLDLQRAGNRLTRATNIRTTIAIALGGLSLSLIIIIAVVYFTAGRDILKAMDSSKSRLDESVQELRALRKDTETTKSRIEKMEQRVKQQQESQPKVVADEETGELRLDVPVERKADTSAKKSPRRTSMPDPPTASDHPTASSASSKEESEHEPRPKKSSKPKPRALIPLSPAKGIELK